MPKPITSILIPNATGPTNLGDQAMLETLLQLIKHEYPKAKITIHSTDVDLYPPKTDFTLRHTLYSHTAFRITSFRYRLSRMILLMGYLAGILFGYKPRAKSTDQGLKRILADYFTSDLIIFVGGGYLRSQPKWTESLNVLMLLIHFIVAKASGAFTIVAPISFGPFAHSGVESLSRYIVLSQDIVSVREKFSYERLWQTSSNPVILSSDHALLLSKKRTSAKTTTDFRLGITLRQWFEPHKQAAFEKAVLKSVINFSQKKRVEIQPIVQVYGTQYGTKDMEICRNLSLKLKQAGIKVAPVQKIANLDQAIDVYSQLDLLLGMRMHSNIIAATQHVPFVAISYEYKTEGIAKQLGVSDYVLRCEQVTATNLYRLLNQAYKKRTQIKRQIKTNLKSLQPEQKLLWQRILNQAGFRISLMKVRSPQQTSSWSFLSK